MLGCVAASESCSWACVMTGEPACLPAQAAQKVVRTDDITALLMKLEQLRLLDWVDQCYQMPNFMRETAQG